jgi:hypothetical protein
MGAREVEGYRTFRASELPERERERLRQTLRHDLTAAMVRQVAEHPPDLVLSEIELVLRPAELISKFNAAAAEECVTCITCITCITCDTT